MRKKLARKLHAEVLESRYMLTHGLAAPVHNPDAPTLPGSLAPCVAQFGDANSDGVFDSDDLVKTLQSAKYLTGQPATFEEGNWNGDGVFDQEDLVAALQFGDYSINRDKVSCVLIDGEHVLNADEIGAANLMNAQTVLEAAKLIKEGNRYSLAYVLENDSPGNPFVSHNMSLDLILGPFPGTNETVALVETVNSNFMHVGTQFDALGHIGIGDQFYNGHTIDDVLSPTGLVKLGAEEVPPFFTRGVLVDIARYKDVEALPPTYEITLDDLEGALAMQGTEIRMGDVVLFHTGWGLNYTPNNEVFGTSSPGIGLEVAESLASSQVVIVGADNWAVEVIPNPDPNLNFPVHQELLTKNGIYLMEVVKTDELAKDGVYEFAFVFAPIRAEGATGSAAHPFAIN